jgi:predicted permease
MLILFSFIVIFTVPIMCLRKVENNVKVEDFPIILEFTGAISFAIVLWHIVKTPK